MSREELKRLWFSIPRDKDKKDFKAVIVNINTGVYQIINDTKEYYSSASHHIGDNVLETVLNRIEKSKECSFSDLSKHQLIIK